MKENETITVTVIYPVTFEVDSKELEGKDKDEVREYILDNADSHMESSPPNPLIHESTNEEIVPID